MLGKKRTTHVSCHLCEQPVSTNLLSEVGEGRLNDSCFRSCCTDGVDIDLQKGLKQHKLCITQRIENLILNEVQLRWVVVDHTHKHLLSTVLIVSTHKPFGQKSDIVGL